MTHSPYVVHLLKQFRYDHLPARLQVVSMGVHNVAHALADQLDSGFELEEGLRKLLEAKDCFVRQAVEDIGDSRPDPKTGEVTIKDPSRPWRAPESQDPVTVVNGDPEGAIIRIVDGKVLLEDYETYLAAVARSEKHTGLQGLADDGYLTNVSRAKHQQMFGNSNPDQ